MAFTHLAISWAFMLSYDKSVKMNKALKGIIEYLNKELPGYVFNKIGDIYKDIKINKYNYN